MQNRSILLFFTEFISIFPLLLIGCNTRQPIFPDSYDQRTRYYVSKETTELIFPGKSNREDLFQYLGEPDAVYQEGRRFIYSWGKTKIPLVITLDEKGTVLRKKYLEEGRPSSFYVQEYIVSPKNVTAFRNLGDCEINVGPFTATEPEKSDIMCRLMGPVRLPFGDPFSDYIREALIEELKNESLISPNASVILTGNLDQVDFDSLPPAKWKIALTLRSSFGKSMTVSVNHSFDSGFFAPACTLSAQAFMPAVQKLMNAILQSPEFAVLVSE